MNRHHMWMALGRSNLGLEVLRCYAAMRGRDLSVINANTDIVIDGYPRSANTIAVAAFRVSQSQTMRIAHHIHSPLQFVKAEEHRIPAVLLIREPDAAIASLSVREPHIVLASAYMDYYQFYTKLKNIVGSLVIAPFDEIVSHYDRTIERVNTKFSTNFNLPPSRPGEFKEIIDEIDRMDMKDRKTSTPDVKSVARPLQSRTNLLERKLAEISKAVPRTLREDALALFHDYLKLTPYRP